MIAAPPMTLRQRPQPDDYEDRLRDQKSRDLYEKAARVHREATDINTQAKKTLETIRQLYDEREHDGR